jgi:heme exporter protein C
VRGLPTLAAATVATVVAAFALVFFYAPNDADQGFIQKIFYLHVPLAICALVGFVAAAVHAIRHLRTGDPVHDARSYVSIHVSVIFGVAVLATGSIWARASWGKWWVWDEPTLVSFLIVFLLYATYYPLRYAIDDRDRQARYASVFAITAGAFVPLNFLAVRLAESLLHPRVFATAEGGMPSSMWLTFVVSLLGIGLLWVTLVRFELAAKGASAQLARLRRALEGSPAPPQPVPSPSPTFSKPPDPPPQQTPDLQADRAVWDRS